MDLHRRIRTLRLRRGLTGIELARRASVSPSYVSLIEHGEKIPSESVAVRLAQALGEREDLYRIWAATSRMDEQTRNAVLRTNTEDKQVLLASGSSGQPFACTHVECPLAEPTEEFSQRPPGRPRKQDGASMDISYRLEDDARSAVLRIPLLTPGIVPTHEPPDHEDIESLLAFDSRMLGRTNADGLVAVRLNENSSREVSCWLGPQDIAVIDRKPTSFAPAKIHAFRLPEGLSFYRACKAGGYLVLLPSPTSTAAPRSIPLEGNHDEHFRRLLFGTVLWSSRAWTE